jgi:ABC-2 type transport system permease protein
MNTLTVARRDFGAYFRSPIAYVVLSIFLLLSGFLFFYRLFESSRAAIDGLFGNMPLILIFFAPAITMGLLAEERASGSIELLTTFPLRDWEIVLGKFLAACGLFTVGVALTIPYAITVAKLGPLDVGPALSGYLGLLLIGYAYLAIGLMASSLTKHQIVAFIVGLGICFLFLLWSWMVPSLPRSLRPFAEYLSTPSHLGRLVQGQVDLRSIVFLLSLIVLPLVIAWQALESRRWS